MKILNEVFDRIFVLTTPAFTDRIANMKQRMIGCDYEFFYGVHGADVDVEKYRSSGSRLSRGQLSCALSHIKIYERMISENLDNVLILEDDCAFYETVFNLKEYYSQLPEDYGVFYLGYDCPVSNQYSNNLIEVTSGSVGYTHSMNVRQSFAKQVLETNSGLMWTADGVVKEILNKYQNKVYLANPKITYQDNDGSTSTLVKVDLEYGW